MSPNTEIMFPEVVKQVQMKYIFRAMQTYRTQVPHVLVRVHGE
jgi:hypothetical protein